MKNTIKSPLFWDLHIHGACGVDFMRPETNQILNALKVLKSSGIGYIAPTLLTSETKLFESALHFWGIFLKKYTPERLVKINAAIPIGLHLEGPFLNSEASGAHPKSQLKNPNLKIFKKYLKLSQNSISIVTIAPELKGAKSVIQFCNKNKIRIQIGHTTASEQTILDANKWGAKGFTHLFNAMKIAHRNPAAITPLLQGKMQAEIITDSYHIDSSYLNFVFKSLSHSLYSVSDACSALCSHSKTNTLGSIQVVTKTSHSHLPIAIVKKSKILAGGASFLTDHPSNLIKNWNTKKLEKPTYNDLLKLFYKIPSLAFGKFKKYYQNQNNYFDSKSLRLVKTDHS